MRFPLIHSRHNCLRSASPPVPHVVRDRRRTFPVSRKFRLVITGDQRRTSRATVEFQDNSKYVNFTCTRKLCAYFVFSITFVFVSVFLTPRNTALWTLYHRLHPQKTRSTRNPQERKLPLSQTRLVAPIATVCRRTTPYSCGNTLTF